MNYSTAMISEHFDIREFFPHLLAEEDRFKVCEEEFQGEKSILGVSAVQCPDSSFPVMETFHGRRTFTYDDTPHASASDPDGLPNIVSLWTFNHSQTLAPTFLNANLIVKGLK